ncbi:MAG: porin [Gammaproteobacteria bacterium]|nr:porin [Gammaproteobacteria bacterium]
MKSRNRILVLAVGLAGGVAAQNVFAAASLYGQLNISLDSLDNSTDSALNISSNSSRIGFKGDIQVGGDLAGIYQIESEVRADTSESGNSNRNSILASRNTFVGLQGAFGVARVGRFDTPVKVIGRQVDLFGDQVGDARNLTRAAGGINRFDERPNNSIDYTSPERAGFKGTLLYSTNVDTAATSTNDNDLLSLGVNYAQGPLFVGVGYESAGNATAAQDDPNIIRLGAYYDLDAWRFTGLWQTLSGAAADGSQDEDVFGLGVRYKTGAWAFKGQVYQLSADADERDASLVALGTEYTLQKGLTLYAAYAGTSNDDGRGVTPYSEGRSDSLAVAANGDSARAISLGTIIKF